MEISISSRNVEITPRLDEMVRAKIGQLDRYMDDLDTAEVHFAEARNPRIVDNQTCEVTLTGRGHHLRCKVDASDAFMAVDLAEAKLERQIRKLRTKLQKRHHGRGDTIRTGEPPEAALAVLDGRDSQAESDAGAEFEAGTEFEFEPAPELRIVKTKRFHLGPLSPQEAALKMDLMEHGFFFFINSVTGRSAVVYRREDGAVGLIDEAG
ncbi:MAG: ribosome-associated translation inhibitor RaiA [Acidimicrobiaceae bacterium]|nr:ribosome-associated translation inhibitor RaiA [Acidimicrobiaceae bacterium]